MQSFVTVLLFRQSAQNIASIVNFLPLLSAFIHFKLADRYVFNQHFFLSEWSPSNHQLTISITRAHFPIVLV